MEALIAQRAFAQHGVVALSDLLDLGLSAAAVRKRVASGRLHRIHAGVYAVGHARMSRDGRYMAAVLACEPDCALSHRSSADKRGLRRSNRSAIDVITPRRAGRGHAGIDARTSRTLLPRDIENVDGIACTSVARTLLDLCAVLPRRAVEQAVDHAEQLRVLDVKQVHDVLSRAGGHRGTGVLRAILREYAGPTLTRNDLEEAFLASCRRAGLPQPEVNVWIALEPIGYEVDFLWRAHWLIAETDGRDPHTTRLAFEHDRVRDQRLMLAGYRVARFPRRQLLEDPSSGQQTMRVLLRQAALRPPQRRRGPWPHRHGPRSSGGMSGCD